MTYVLADGALVEQRDGTRGQALLGLALRDVPELLRVLLVHSTRSAASGHRTRHAPAHGGTLPVYIYSCKLRFNFVNFTFKDVNFVILHFRQ